MIIEVQKAIKRFHQDCKELGQSIMADHNSVPITIALLIQNEERQFETGVSPDIGLLYDTEDKEPFINAMEKLIGVTKPLAIGIISEAWMVKRTTEQGYNFDIPVREQEDRVESLIVQIQTYNETYLTVYEMIKEGDQIQLKLSEEHSNISKEKVGGLFSELLKENYESFSKSIEENLKNNLN